MKISSLFSFPELTNPENIEANRLGKITPQQKLANLALFPRIISFGTAVQANLWTVVLPALLFFLVFALPLAGPLKTWLLGLVVIIPLCWVGYLVARGLSRLAAVRRDLDEGNIRHEDGKLTYGRSSYEARIFNGEILRLPIGWSDLKPGIRYRFYYLEGSRTVLSAETVQVLSDPEALSDLQESLANANRFSLQDMQDNRSGRIGPAQGKRLLPKLLLGAGIMLPSTGFLIFILYSLLFAPGADPSRNWINVLIFTLVTGVFVVIGGVMAWKAVADLMQGSVTMIEGVGQKLRRVSRSSSNRGTTITYYYQVDDQRIAIPERAYAALVDGLRYRVYRTPRSGVLMSIEPLEPPHWAQAEENQPWTQLQTL